LAYAELYRRFLTGRRGRRPAEKGLTLFNPQSVQITRYRWRANRIPTPWASNNMAAATAAT
jgi:RNA-directed DNA polymerase